MEFIDRVFYKVENFIKNDWLLIGSSILILELVVLCVILAIYNQM